MSFWTAAGLEMELVEWKRDLIFFPFLLLFACLRSGNSGGRTLKAYMPVDTGMVAEENQPILS